MIIDFIFDGQELSGFGYIICDFNSSSELETSTVSDMSFTDIKSPLSNISHVVGTSYTNNLSRTIQIMKNPCSNDELDITNDDISELSRWLCRKEYKQFKWIDDKDDDEIFYEVRINLRQIELGNGRIGAELDITANRPFGFTREITNKIINNTSESAEGREILIGNATNSILTGYGVYGKSEQKSYTGKNLVECVIETATYNGITITKNSDGTYAVNGTSTKSNSISVGSDWYIPMPDWLIPGESYIISGSGLAEFRIYFYKEDKTTASSYYQNWQFTVPTEAVYYGIYISHVLDTVYTNDIIYPMIRKASITDSTYEQYVGGEPSPNPSYPQDIESVADDGNLVVKSNNKNLLENTAIGKTSAGITFVVNEDNSVTASGTATANTSLILDSKRIPNGRYILSGRYNIMYALWMKITFTDGTVKYPVSTQKEDEQVFTIDDNVAETIIYAQVINGATLTNATIYPMLRLASIEDSTYIPYQSSTQATIPLTDSLRGIKVSEGGNYTDESGQQWVCDTLEKYADGSGKLVQRVVGLTIDDFEVIEVSADANWYDSEKSYSYEIKKPKIDLSNAMTILGMCTHFTSYTFAKFYSKNIETGCMNNQMYIVVNISKSLGICQSVNAFKQYCIDNNVQFIKALATPIETPLTAEQIAEIEKLQTFEGVTYITNEDDAYQKVTYKKKTKPHSLTVYSDDEGYIYPDMTITIKEVGNLELINSFENRLTYIANCKVGEVITIVGGDTLQILSSDESHDLSKCFNYKFPRLCTEYRNYTNTISTNIACEIEIKYKGIRKVGI